MVGSPFRWKLTVEYDGGAYVGWERQPNGPSIQQLLEEAAAPLVGHAVRIEGSGRTDAGVHAEGQVAAFSTTTERPAKAVRDGLNARLPADVAVVAAELVEPDFDPRRSARIKHYRYRWLDRPVRSPLRRGRVWHLRRPLDAAVMHDAVLPLIGEHDFSSFRAAGCGAAHARRTIPSLAVHRHDDEVHLDALGHGFLRHMIRIVAGTLTEVGLGRWPVERVAEALAARQRSAAGPTAPAHGLVLLSVHYDEG